MKSDAFASNLRERLGQALTRVAPVIAERAQRAEWHIEFPPSRVYDFVGLLIFTREDDPTAELSVLSVELKRSPSPQWTIDIVGRDSLGLAELRDLAPDLQAEMASDPGLAASIVADFLRDRQDLVVKELTDGA